MCIAKYVAVQYRKENTMEKVINVLNWLKKKINERFEDRENIMRFFRAEYGRDAETAYNLWITKRELYTKYH